MRRQLDSRLDGRLLVLKLKKLDVPGRLAFQIALNATVSES
jgi:hypothetical protein